MDVVPPISPPSASRLPPPPIPNGLYFSKEALLLPALHRRGSSGQYAHYRVQQLLPIVSKPESDSQLAAIDKNVKQAIPKG